MPVKLKMRFRMGIMLLAMLLAACGGTPAATETPPPTLTSTDSPTLVPTLTYTPTLDFINFITATPGTPTAGPDVTQISPVIETDLIAPVRIKVPESWSVANAAIQMPDGGTILGLLPFSIYRGPVTGGTGYITVVWGFRNVTTTLPFQESGAQINLRADGIRLLNLAILDPGCNIGIDVDREFRVGEGFGAGAYFAATDCPTLPDGTPGLPDTKGWFVVTKPSDLATGMELNFAFYIYTDPAAALEGAAQAELEAMMESVEFDFAMLPTPEPTLTFTPAP